MKTPRRQRPVRGGRDRLPVCVIKAIKRAVERGAARENVSESFFTAVVLAHGLGIEDQEQFSTPQRLRRVK